MATDQVIWVAIWATVLVANWARIELTTSKCEWAENEPDFGRSADPISTRGTEYAQQIILAPPDFQT